MGVDVVHLLRGDSGSFQGSPNGKFKAPACGLRNGDIVTIRGLSPTRHLRVNVRPARPRVLGIFHNERGGTPCSDKAAAATIKGPAGQSGIGVLGQSPHPRKRQERLPNRLLGTDDKSAPQLSTRNLVVGVAQCMG